MLAVNYVIYGCSSWKTTPGIIIIRASHWWENTVVVITEDRVIDDNLKR